MEEVHLAVYVLAGVGSLVSLGFLYSIVYISLQYALNGIRKTRVDLKGKHVLVTGGSSGIGKEVAKQVATLGAHVSILARSQSKLSEAAEEIKSAEYEYNGTRKVVCVAVDLSKSFETVDAAVSEATSKLGPVYMLVNCAGFSISKKFENLTPEDGRRMMDLNYFGSVNATRSVLPAMKASAGGGIIVYVASQASLLGVFGLSCYSGSKFAIRGFAEALAMELAPFNVKVAVNCPPDTETPGLNAENVGKPEETALISAYGGLFKPDEVARTLLNDVWKGRFLGSTGIDGWVAVKLASGTANSSFFELLMEVFILGPLRFISWLYVKRFYSIINRCHRNRNGNKKLN